MNKWSDEIIGRPIEFYHGVKGKERETKVIELLKMIELDETFIDRLPSELSGGQKQRICIARALYSEPDIIFFDEATSALDGITEKNVLNSVLKFSTNRTVIIVAHRLSTLQNCDDIFFMEDGKISDSGTYNYFKENNEKFRQMERINENNEK